MKSSATFNHIGYNIRTHIAGISYFDYSWYFIHIVFTNKHAILCNRHYVHKSFNTTVKWVRRNNADQHSMSFLYVTFQCVSPFCSIFTMRTSECWQFTALPSLMMSHVPFFLVRFTTMTYIASLTVDCDAST